MGWRLQLDLIVTKLPAQNPHIVIRMSGVLQLRRECIQNCGTMFFLLKTTRLTFFRTSQKDNAATQSSPSNPNDAGIYDNHLHVNRSFNTKHVQIKIQIGANHPSNHTFDDPLPNKTKSETKRIP